MLSLKRLSRVFVGYGSEKAQDIEFQCQTIVYIAMVAMPTAIVFAIINFFSGHIKLASVEIIAVLLLIPCLKVWHHKKHIKFIRNLLMANGFMVFLALFYYGGIGSSGVTWSLIFPFLVFLLVGLPMGWYWAIPYGILMATLIWAHNFGYVNLPYENDFLLYFPVTYLFFVLIAAVLELQLEQLHTRHEMLKNTLEDHVTYKTKALSKTNLRLTEEIEQHKKTERELIETEKKYIHAQRMESLGTLVGGIAHDFNNMLAGIIGNVFLAKRKAGENEGVIEKLNNIENLSGSASEMIKQLLVFARKDAVHMKTFSLTPFFKETLKLGLSGVPESIDFTYDISNQDMLIKGDTTQLQQLFMNLLNNARDAVEGVEKPTIHCELKEFFADEDFCLRHPNLEGSSFARLSISDNGIGINKEVQEKIFEPFFTTKAVGKGTGLGLSMVFGAVQRHNGKIELESEGGKGTIFHIYLPIEESQTEATGKLLAPIFQGGGETILVVDDEESVRKSTQEVLSNLGYRVLVSSDGEEALEVFTAHQDEISLLMTDLVMPKMGGVELAHQVHILKEKLPIIFATAYDKKDALEGGVHVDNSVVITKPFSFNELSQFIRTAIDPE